MNQQEIEAYIAGLSQFKGLEPAEIRLLAEHAKVMHYSENDVVFRQDEPASNFYIVRSGSIIVEIPSIWGAPLQVQELKKGNVLGWSWLIPPYKWNFRAMTAEDSELVVFDGKSILEHCEENPKLGYDLMKCFTRLMGERLQGARQQVMEIAGQQIGS